MIHNIITVEVVYALPNLQFIRCVKIHKNSTIEDVINLSGLLKLFKNINLHKNKVGIFGKQVNLYDKVNNGDRLEIYRPITCDPKNIRSIRIN